MKGFRLRGMGFDWILNADQKIVAQFPNVSDHVAIETLEGESLRPALEEDMTPELTEAGWTVDLVSIIS